METVKISRQNKGLCYKPELNLDINNLDLINFILFEKEVKKSKTALDEVEAEFLEKNKMRLHINYFTAVTSKHTKIKEIIEHTKEKAFVLTDFCTKMNCMCFPDYEIPYDNPSLFDDGFRLFLDQFIPLVEGENELSLEWIQATIKELCVELGIKVKVASIALQMALTGESQGISGWHVMSWNSPSSTLARLNRAYFYNLKSYTF
jgi:hypothetical protein